jgi:hypothetical protein
MKFAKGCAMNDLTYRMLAKMLDAFLWGGDLLDDENLPKKGPAVFIANHIGSLGPIGAVCSIPLRLYPWIIADTIDPVIAAEYVRVDFVEKELHLPMPLSLWLSEVITRMAIPLMNAVGVIPVPHDYEGQCRTLDTSLQLLLKGKCLLVFPEDPNQERDECYNMCPFQKTVMRLGEMYYKASRQRLKFYPLVVHETRVVRVGEPVAYNPLNAPAKERLRLKNLLEDNLHKMYLEITMTQHMGIPSLH